MMSVKDRLRDIQIFHANYTIQNTGYNRTSLEQWLTEELGHIWVIIMRSVVNNFNKLT
jgi:hypothetical protein